MMIAHITDPHLVRRQETLFGLDPMHRLDRVLTQIERDYADVRLCVISGDLTDRADAEAYMMLRERLTNFPIQTRLMLGNHDDRAEFRSVFSDTAADAHGFIQYFDDIGDLRLIYLDTLAPGSTAGKLCEKRLSWLADTLTAAADKDVAIFTHYPFRRIGLPHFEGMLLSNPDAVMSLLKAHGRVRHIFCGHVHVSMSGQWDGIPFTVSAGTAHQILPDFSSRNARFVATTPQFDIATLDGNSFRVVRVEAEERQVLAISAGV